MLKGNSRLNSTMRMFLALMMAVPQGLNVYAEETAEPEVTVTESETQIEEVPEAEELTFEKRSLGSCFERSSGSMSVDVVPSTITA